MPHVCNGTCNTNASHAMPSQWNASNACSSSVPELVDNGRDQNQERINASWVSPLVGTICIHCWPELRQPMGWNNFRNHCRPAEHTTGWANMTETCKNVNAGRLERILLWRLTPVLVSRIGTLQCCYISASSKNASKSDHCFGTMTSYSNPPKQQPTSMILEYALSD